MFGTALAHLGLGLTVLGIVGVVSLEAERILTMRPGETMEISGYTLRFEGIQPFKGPNYTEDRGRFVLTGRGGAALGEIVSAKRFYPVRQMPTTEAGIKTLGLSQLYVSLGDATPDGGVVVRVWWKPLVTLIWLGGLVMMIGRRDLADGPAAACRRARRDAAGRLPQTGLERAVNRKRLAVCGCRAVSRSLRPAWRMPCSPDEVLADPALEARARALSAELRCMVCQNQSIDDSDAELARDLRILVRDRLKAGDTDAEVMDYRRLALWRVRAFEAALQHAQRAAVGHADHFAAGWRRFCQCCGAVEKARRSQSVGRGKSGTRPNSGREREMISLRRTVRRLPDPLRCGAPSRLPW